MTCKKLLFATIMIMLLGCSSDNDPALKNEYNFLIGGTDVEIFVLKNNQYEDHNNEILENNMDWIGITQAQTEGSQMYNHTFSKLVIQNNEQGILSRNNGTSEYPVSLNLFDEVLHVTNEDFEIDFKFKLSNNGEKIESCKYVAVWSSHPRTFQSNYEFYYQIDCDNLSYKEAANRIREQYDLTSDTIALFESIHESK